jgi:hypothetical protein
MLGGELVNGFLEQVGLSIFMLYLPEVYYPAQTAKFLYDVENGAIGVVQAKIEYDQGRVQTLQWPTEEDKRRALVIIQNDEKTIEKWNREAREEARTGINWSRLSPSNGSRGYRFNPGRSYEQLRTIQSFGWLKR